MKHATLLAALAILWAVAYSSPAATINWTGSGSGNNWSTGANWTGGAGPGTTNTALFGNAGASSIPGEVTVRLIGDRTVGGVSISNSTNNYHTADLGGFTLSVAGDVHFNTNQTGQTTTIFRNGRLHVDAPLGLFNVGRSYSGGASAQVDFGTLTEFRADVNEFHVGTRISGNTSGGLTLAESNVIDATEIVVGQGASGSLHLGSANTIFADEWLIAGSYSNATVDVVSGGVVELGAVDRPISLFIGDGVTNTNSTYAGTLDLSTATVNAYFDHLVVGRKDNNPGNQKGTLLGGDGGSVTVGSPDDPSTMIVGQRATGLLDLAAMDTFTAHLDQLILGRSRSGTVRLPENATVDAREIVVGDNGSAALSLGLNNTILADEMLIAGSYSNATVDARPGGAVHLGAPDRPVSLTIGKGITNTNSTYAGTLDLSNTALIAYLDHLIVGQKDTNPGNQKGTFLGGDSGSISIGTAGNTANMIVGDRGSGTVDFAAMDAFTANLDQMIIGRSKSGSVALADTNTIDARKISVSAGASATLALGLDNTILVDEMNVGSSYGTGNLSIRNGGTLRLGAPDRRTSLTIGKARTNTNSTYSGTVDLTNATFIAYLDHVIVGEKDNMPGGQRGTLTVSEHDDNFVDAVSIVIGGTKSTGTLDFGGGEMFAGSIERGAGTAHFNWTGGTLHVDAFGAPERSFSLVNNGDGVLAPGGGIGTSEIFGDYTQGLSAALQVELESAALFDQLVVHEDLALDGTLYVDVTGGPAGDFPIVQYGTRSGQFDDVVVRGLMPGTYSIDYGSGTNDFITLTTVPEPTTLLLAAVALLGLLGRAWRRRS